MKKNKAIIIITTDDRKSDRFIKFTNENQQEWVDGWCFDKTKKYALRKNSSQILFFDKIVDVLSNINETDNYLIIWVNQYLFSNKTKNLIQELNELYDNLIKKSFDAKVAVHNIPMVNYSFKPYSYSLEQTKQLRFQKIIIKNISDELILNSSANFNDIEEVFFHPLEYQKKNLINLWLPLTIDIQGLSEVQNDEKKFEKYFKEIQKENEYLNSLTSFPKDEDFPRWNEIIEELKKNNSYAECNPKSIAKMLLDETDFDKFRQDEKKYLEKTINDNDNPNFLPNWLQEVVKVIDAKLMQNS